MKYEDASWHYDGDFPKDLPTTQAGVHIGMFLAWAIHNDLIGAVHLEEAYEEVKKVKARQMTGTQFLFDICDEKLTGHDLNNEGNSFASHYLEEENDYDYLMDYSDVFDECDSLYEVEDSWINFDKISAKISEQFTKWKN